MGGERSHADEPMPLVRHLEELRRRLLYCLAAFVVSTAAGLFAAGPVLRFLQRQPAVRGYEWVALSPWEPIRIYVAVAFTIGLAVSLPFTLWQLWLFVRPGLREAERQAAVKYVPSAAVLFLAGLAFAYYVVFPMAFYFATEVSRSLDLKEMYGISQYVSFLIGIVVPTALLFELPVVVMFLTRIRLVTPRRLRRFRRYAYLALVVVATTVTPPDMISDVLVAVPLVLLYEFSVALSDRVYRRMVAEADGRES